MREIVRKILYETVDLFLGLVGLTFLVSIGCLLKMIWERMVKLIEYTITKIRKTKAVCK